MSEIVLYDYWRSSASYRVRIALHLKNLPFRAVSIDLVGGQQRSDDHLKRQPQGLVPALQIDGKILTQSLAIIAFLDSLVSTPHMMPRDVMAKARVQSLSYALAMEVHPICNLAVVNHVAEITGGGDPVKLAWMQRFISAGLAAFETNLQTPETGSFCHGDTPGMADCCLIPQLYNANRWGVSYSAHENICRIEQSCQKLAGFKNAHPDNYKP